jgi:hypothetical protein
VQSTQTPQRCRSSCIARYDRAMQLIQEPDWPSLGGLYRALQAEAGQLLNAGEFESAAALYERAYRALLEAQPEGRRFHKGEALHNLGLALLWLGRTDEARQRTLEAFVEDAASLAEESPRYDELDRPAAHNLVYVFGTAGQALALLSRIVRDYVGTGNLLPDPRPFLESSFRIVSPVPPAPGGVRIIGQHRLPPEKRVFIGGGFAHLDTHLRPMRDLVDAVGHEGVVAADFGVPHGWRDDDVALGLMHQCHYGLFDLTDPAGQMVEIAALPDRKHNPARTLAVWDRSLVAKPAVSYGMVLSRLEDWGVKPIPYDDVSDLGTVIAAWLPAR